MYVVMVHFTHRDCPRHYRGKYRSRCSGVCYTGTFGLGDQFDEALNWAQSVQGKEHPKRPEIVLTGAEVHLVESVQALWHV